MEIVKEILINHWKLILSLLLIIFSVILLIVKKKPVQDIVSDIFIFAVAAVIEVENEGIIGAEQKLANATAKVCSALKNKYPDIAPLKYKDIIHRCIEAILSTPQKHETK